MFNRFINPINGEAVTTSQLEALAHEMLLIPEGIWNHSENYIKENLRLNACLDRLVNAAGEIIPSSINPPVVGSRTVRQWLQDSGNDNQYFDIVNLAPCVNIPPLLLQTGISTGQYKLAGTFKNERPYYLNQVYVRDGSYCQLTGKALAEKILSGEVVAASFYNFLQWTDQLRSYIHKVAMGERGHLMYMTGNGYNEHIFSNNNRVLIQQRQNTTTYLFTKQPSIFREPPAPTPSNNSTSETTISSVKNKELSFHIAKPK